MNRDSDFYKIGKRMPYQVPEGFFSKITGETLQRARLRDKAERRRMLIIRSLTAAASFIILVVLGLMVFSPVPEKESVPVASKSQPISVEQEVLKDNPPVINHEGLERNPPPQISEEKNDIIQESEKMEDLLASLSDEDLLEWASALKTDYFTDESEIDKP